MPRTAFAGFILGLSLAEAGCGGGNSNANNTANSGGNGNVSTAELGKTCSTSCNGTFCKSGGTQANRTCPTSDAAYPCLGTATGMYCTGNCSTDSDCLPAAQPMKCLAECTKHPDATGLCWSSSDYDFMVASVCGSASGLGTGGASATATVVGGSSSYGNTGGSGSLQTTPNGTGGSANVAGAPGAGGATFVVVQGGAVSVGGSSNTGTSGNTSTGVGGVANTGGSSSSYYRRTRNNLWRILQRHVLPFKWFFH